MSALNQYTDLYLQNRELIDSNSAEPLNRLRPDALASLEKHLLPPLGSENYEITDLEKLLSPDFGINLARIPLDVNPAASFSCGVPSLSSALFLLVNDAWAELATSRANLPDGVEIGSLRALARSNPEPVASRYGKIANIDNPIVALNTLLVQDGMYLRVKRGVRLERPIQLVNILAQSVPFMALRRLLIIIEDDAEAKLLVCDHTQNSDADLASLQTVEIFVGRNATFDYYDLEESSDHTTRLSTLYLSQEADSNVLIDAITLFNGHTRNEFHCVFKAPGATLKLLGMGIEDGDRVLDTFSHVNHIVGKCHTDELFKYVVDDRAKGSFVGRILVDYGAEKTEAYQSNRNIVGSDSARMYSKPQLEIYNDDVKCSHGTAIGRLDELQLFYMRTRGLDEDTAKLLLKQAFMADVIDGVRLQSLKDRLKMLVERRFTGEISSCSECGACHPQA